MGYEDRDYFREQPRMGFEPPRLGKVSKILLGLVGFGFLLVIFTGGSGSPGHDLTKVNFPTVIEALSLSSNALLPLDGNLPRPWQLLTSALMFHNVLDLLLSAVIGIWLIGAAIERDMGWRNYAKFLIAAQLSAGIAAALIDPFLGRAMADTGTVYSLGLGSLTVAMLAGIAAYRGNQPSIFGWKLRTWVVVLLVISVLLSLTSYRLSEGQMTSVLVVRSLPGMLAAAAFGWFAMGAMAGRGMLRAVGPKAAKEEDYGAYVRHLGGEVRDASPGADTSRRQRDERRFERETRRRKEEQEALDALLERISKDGIDSLSRSEKSFLERVSRRKREEEGL